MVNRIETVYSCGSNKGFSSSFCVQHETPEEGQRTYWPKHCDYNNKDEVNSQNILSNNNISLMENFLKKFYINTIITTYLPH